MRSRLQVVVPLLTEEFSPDDALMTVRKRQRESSGLKMFTEFFDFPPGTRKGSDISPSNFPVSSLSRSFLLLLLSPRTSSSSTLPSAVPPLPLIPSLYLAPPKRSETIQATNSIPSPSPGIQQEGGMKRIIIYNFFLFPRRGGDDGAPPPLAQREARASAGILPGGPGLQRHLRRRRVEPGGHTTAQELG